MRDVIIIVLTCLIIFLLSFAAHTIIDSTNTVTEQVIVLDYESQYYKMHCNAVADILAKGGSNKTIKTYLEITGAKIQ